MQPQIVFLTALLSLGLIASEYRIEAEWMPNQGQWVTGKNELASEGRMAFSSIRSLDNVLAGEYSFPKGKYYVWVRSLSFGQRFRVSTMLINGSRMGDFGDAPLPKEQKTSVFLWNRAEMPIDLPDGKTKIEFQATSEYGRVDAVIFSNDEKFTPPDNPVRISKIPLIAFPDTIKNSPRRVSQDMVDIHAKSPLEQVFVRPASTGTGPEILLFNGGRPWVANDNASFFIRSGARTMLINSIFLNGEGGASIRTFPSDKEEPTPVDGITPALEELENYKLFIVNGIPAENQKNIFTLQRVQKIREYVYNGGALLLTIHAPDTLEELLPVKLGKLVSPASGLIAEGSAENNFSTLPEQYPVIEPYREATLQPESKILSRILDVSAKEQGIFIAEKKFGKGKVLFVNTQIARREGTRQFYNWAYNRALFIALANEAGNLKLNVDSGVFSIPKQPDPKEHGLLHLVVRPRQMNLSDGDSIATVTGNEIHFKDGTHLRVQPDGAVDITYPGKESPGICHSQAPTLFVSGKQAVFDS